jgi:hypothetical protein
MSRHGALDDLPVAATQQLATVVLLGHPPTEVGVE